MKSGHKNYDSIFSNFTPQNKIMEKEALISPNPYHVPALLTEALDLLDIRPDGIYVDVTFGGGGHSRGVLSRLGQKGRLIGFDRDIDALANVPDDSRFLFIHSNFRYIRNFLRYHGIGKVDGIIADLGVSFHHFDTPERGFSFRADSPLDMRMNREAPLTAADLIASATEEELIDLLKKFTDLKRASGMAKAIVKAREEAPVDSTFRLLEAIRGAIDPRQEKKELAQVFQAFRIATNHEIDDLRIFLESTLHVLRPGGRLAVLTYHSVEDRMVKNFMKTGNTQGKEEKDFFGNFSTPWKILTRKPIEPSPQEIESNPRSRSARLRVAQLKEENG